MKELSVLVGRLTVAVCVSLSPSAMKRQRKADDTATSAGKAAKDDKVKTAVPREAIDLDESWFVDAEKKRVEEAEFVATAGDIALEPFWSHCNAETEMDGTPSDADAAVTKNKKAKKNKKSKKKKNTKKKSDDSPAGVLEVRKFTEEELAAARENEPKSFEALEQFVSVFRQKKPRTERSYGEGPVTFVSRIPPDVVHPADDDEQKKATATTVPAAEAAADADVKQEEGTEMTDKLEGKTNNDSAAEKADGVVDTRGVTRNTLTFTPESEVPFVLSREQVEPPCLYLFNAGGFNACLYHVCSFFVIPEQIRLFLFV